MCPQGIRSVGHISNEGTVQMIVIGVDTHKRSHTLVALDAATGVMRGQLTIAASDEGTLAALRFASELDEERVWAVEDCRHGASSAALTPRVRREAGLVLSSTRRRLAISRGDCAGVLTLARFAF